MKNWKNDDDLFNLAFGELDDHAAQKLEAQLMGDAEAMKEVDLLRQLRSDMSGLRDIPEMQFSKERLRDAILSSGAKPAKRLTPWLNWIMAPVAALSIAAMTFVALNGAEKPKTQIVASSTKPISIELPETKRTESLVATADARRAAVNVPAVTVASKPTKKSFRAKIRRSSTGIVATLVKREASITVPPTNFGSGETSPDTAIPMAVAAKTADVKPEPPAIVVIDTTTDSGVGAPVAMEVTNPSNVVIGG